VKNQKSAQREERGPKMLEITTAKEHLKKNISWRFRDEP